MIQGLSWQRLLGIILPFTVILFLGLARLSDLPTGSPKNDAVLRLGWRLAGAKIKKCQEQPPAALANLPKHMQVTKFCEEEGVSYQLVVTVNNDKRIDTKIAPTGMRSDRPLFVFEELSLPPGQHSLTINFAPVKNPGNQPELKTYRYDGSIIARAGRIVLVEMTDDGSQLAVRD